MGNCTSSGGGGGGGSSAAAKGGGATKALDEIITATGETEITVDVRKRNKKARNEYSKEVLQATVDENGNVTFSYPTGTFSGNYGDEYQTVTYKLKAGAVNGEPFGIDLSKAETVSGNTYSIRAAAKKAGMTWNEKAQAWVKSNHWVNSKTDYSEAELKKMGNKELRKVFDASYGKYRLYMGDSLGDIGRKLASRREKQADKDFMIKAIEQSQKYIK